MLETKIRSTVERNPQRVGYQREQAALRSGGLVMAAEAAPQKPRWADYLAGANQVLSGETAQMRTRVDNGELKGAVVDSEVGSIDIIHLLQPGATIRRERPDGDLSYLLVKNPYVSTSQGREVAKLFLQEVGSGRTLNIQLDALVAPPVDQKAWRLDVPAQLPDEFPVVA